ncbi:hypothetical protein BC826DRAFT_1026970 [Russula brevipes]|nr:hypothetical protein BC826DRAFT_1026970 [Russula brevipes]
MQRFRKWSDAKRTPLPESLRSSTASPRNSTHPSEPLPALPPVGDFRTSLILPDLSRRFTLLRAASGDPLSLDSLKSRLAVQRARGSENFLSEEEANMFLQTLGRLRSKPSAGSTSGESFDGTARESLRSTETTSSSLPSTPSSAKRYSNNMFGSGKFRDYTYLRSVAKDRAGKGSVGRRGANSSSLSSRSYKSSDTTIPEDSSLTDPEPSAHDSDTTPLASGIESSVAEFERGVVKTFQPGHLRRASMALDEVIREIEEEADDDGDGDDKILIPRSPAPERASSVKRRSADKPRLVPPSEPSIYETGTAVSPDPTTPADAAEFRSTPSPYPRAETSPIPRLPGYIPGMPRPMTPRDPTFDPDEVSPSSSSTPRATSPRIPGTDRPTSPNVPSSSVARRDSTSVRQSHRASSPLSAPIASLISGANGRFTPDRSHTPDGQSVEFGNPHDSSLLGRRRPASPFSQGMYQSMTVSSRPSTPSNVTWKTPSSPGGGSRSGSVMGFSELDFAVAGLPSQFRNGFDRPSMHARNDSNMSSSDLHEVAQLNRSGSLMGSRSMRSPALPDSPVLETAPQSIGVFTLSKRGQLSSPGSDIGSSSLGSAALRSSTPTQYPPYSSTSPAFSDYDLSRSSRRGSRQATASPFALSQSQTLVLSPLANSSRSSLESAGSSYHTWEADKQDRTLPLVTALEPHPPAWHDLSKTGDDLAPAANGDVEEIRLVFAAKLKAVVSEPRERRNSLRRRRPSTTPPSRLSTNPRGSRTNTAVVAKSSAEPDSSSVTRRKNALTRALFGASDSEQSLTSPSPPPTDEPNTGSSALPTEGLPLIESSISSRSLRETLSPSSPSVNAGALASSSSVTEPLDKQQELAKEVQRKTEAAMADLKKVPSNAKVNDISQRKRVEVGQISGPKLVSASTSVDTIPVRSPSAASGQLSAAQNQSANLSRFGTRFKKIRGSLRAKPALPASDESTQHSLDVSSANTDRSLAGTPDGHLSFSASEASRSKVTIASPQATASPGLKGFVSRLLKPRSGETPTPEPERRKPLPSSSSSYFAQQQLQRQPEMNSSRQSVRSAPPDNKSFRPLTPVSPEPTSLSQPPPTAPPVSPSVPDISAGRAVDENALRQFIDAANNLGVDQDALTEFLARSSSIGSRLTGQSTKHVSAISSDKFAHGKGDPHSSEPMPLFAGGSSARSSVGQPPRGPSGEVVGKTPIRRPLARNATAPESAHSTILRRTLIFPSEGKQSTLEPGTGLRKSSSTRRRRSTASVHSNRSLHDRVPTPPPPKTSANRRFSAEQSPPVPHIPNSLLAQTEAVNAPQSAPVIPLEKSSSAYDSL